MLVFTDIIEAFVETVLKWKAHNEIPPTIINQNLPVTFIHPYARKVMWVLQKGGWMDWKLPADKNKK